MAKKNVENLDEIKLRILQFLEIQKFGKYSFYNKIGLSASNFAGKSLESALSSTKISEILHIFPDLNPDWLLLGKGQMLRTDSTTETTSLTQLDNPSNPLDNPDKHIIELQDKLIKQLEHRIETIESENDNLRIEIAELQKQLKKKVATNTATTPKL